MQLDLDLFVQLAYALGVGVLIGLERTLVVTLSEKAGGARPSQDAEPAPGEAEDEPRSEDAEPALGEAEDEPRSEDAEPAPGEAEDEPRVEPAIEDPPDDVGELLGVRTFALLSLTGYAAAVIGDRFTWVPAVALGAIALLIIAQYRRALWAGVGITTEVAAIGTCGLGMLCRFQPHMAGVIALVFTAILAAKRFAHGTIAKMRRVELTDTLKFLAVIVIVLPLLPNKAYDPWGAFNPYKVGFLVILISGISFIGYFLTRILGAQRGLGITGVVGGLASSTAVTVAMATEARRDRSLGAICAFSTLAANATMFVRVLVVVAVLDRALVVRLAWSVGAMALTATLAAILLWILAGRSEGAKTAAQPTLTNPFSVGPALKFAAFFVVILFVAKLAKTYFGDRGLFAAAALSGLADVDAITLSIAEQSKGGTLARSVGAIGITIAVVSNSVVKSGIAIYSGGWRFGRIIAAALGAATVVGLGVAFLI